MSFIFSVVSGVAGGLAGLLVSRIVKRCTSLPGGTETLWTAICSAAVMVAFTIKFGGPGKLLLVYGVLGLVLIGVSLFDIRTHQIPHLITIPGTVLGLVIGTFVLPVGFTGSLLGVFAGGGTLIIATLIERFRKHDIGGGDWKYAAMIGSFVGWPKILLALIFTSVLGLLGGLVMRLAGIPSKPQAFGPWLSAGAVASILWG